MSITKAKILRITFQNIRPDSENSFKSKQAHPVKHFVFTGQAPGVAEDPKGLKPTDCDCWWVGERLVRALPLKFRIALSSERQIGLEPIRFFIQLFLYFLCATYFIIYGDIIKS